MTILEICAIIAVIIFAALTAFIIKTLLVLQGNLKKTDRMLGNFQQTIANVSEVTENATDRAKGSVTQDVAEWVILSFKLGDKFFNRR